MTVYIDKTPREHAKQRVLVAEKWGDTWVEAKMLGEGVPNQDDQDGPEFKRYGFEVVRYERKAFPDIGTAVIRFHYGFITWRLYQISGGGTGADVQPSAAGDDIVSNRLRFLTTGSVRNSRRYRQAFRTVTGNNEFTVQDLANYEVRIQEKVIIDPDDPELDEWRDVFWGKAGTPRDVCTPGSEIPQGVMEWQILDGTARLAEWPLNGHRFADVDGGSVTTAFPHAVGALTTFVGTCPGNPGYNVKTDDLGRVVGNRADVGDTDGSNKGYYAHTWPGAEYAVPFTDAEVATTAIQSSKPRSTDPDFTPTGVTCKGQDTLQLLNRVQIWETSESMSVRNLLTRILDRRRGIMAYLDWPDTACTSFAASAFAPIIRIVPTFYETISKTLPASGDEWQRHGFRYAGTDADGNATGSTQQNIAVDLDITGDQRLGEDGEQTFTFAEDGLHRYDKLVTRGGQIVTVLTMQIGPDPDFPSADTWVRRSTSAERTNYQSAGDRYNAVLDTHVYADYGLPLDWDCKVYDEILAAEKYVDWQIKFDASTNANTLVTGDSITNFETSPMMIRLLDYPPLYAGMDYTQDPPVPTSNADGAGVSRTPIDVLLFDQNGYNALETEGVQIQRAGNGGNDIRITVDPGTDPSTIDGLEMSFTFAIQTGHRLQWSEIAMEDDAILSDPVRVKYIDAGGLTLHVASGTTKWYEKTTPATPDTTRISQWHAAGYLILRDDRDALVKQHALAAEYYLKPRRPVTISLLTVGGHPQAIKDEITAYTDIDGETAEGNEAYRFPRIGDFLHDLTYSGRTATCDGVVTSYAYDREAGRVTIETDWMTRDLI